jgi:CheY-like chemotaxis protein
MGGLACIMEIRRLQEEEVIIGHVPVIAVSANARVEQIADAIGTGMVSVIPLSYYEVNRFMGVWPLTCFA